MTRGPRVDAQAVDDAKTRLLAYPRAARKSLSARQAVLRLKEAVEFLRTQDYSIAEIATIITKEVVPITPTTLKSILSHANDENAGGKNRHRPKGRGRPSKSASKSQGVALPAGSNDREKAAIEDEQRTETGQQLPSHSPSPLRGSAATTSAIGASQVSQQPVTSLPASEQKSGTPKAGSFTPRRDSEDI